MFSVQDEQCWGLSLFYRKDKVHKTFYHEIGQRYANIYTLEAL